MFFRNLNELYEQYGFPFVAENVYRKERYIFFEKDKYGWFTGRLLKKDRLVPQFGESDAFLRGDSSVWTTAEKTKHYYKKEDNVLFVNF